MMSFIFHKNTASAGVGQVFNNTDRVIAINLTFDAQGTFTASFEGKNDNAKWCPLMAARLSDLSLVTTASSAGEIYQVPVFGVDRVRVNVTAVEAGKPVSCYGKAVKA